MRRASSSAPALPLALALPLLLLLSCLCTTAHAYPLGDNGTASPASVVLAPDGLARFTVLTERVIRMERRASRDDAFFVDAPSLSFINRQLPTPPFTNAPNGTHCVETTLPTASQGIVGSCHRAVAASEPYGH